MGKNTDKLGVMEKDNKSVFEVNLSLYIFVIGFRKLLQIMRKRIYCLFIALFVARIKAAFPNLLICVGASAVAKS